MDVVYLNVGGVYYLTRAETLRRGSTFFAAMLRSKPDATEFFVDRDPTHFRHVLNWLRGVHALPEDAITLEELFWESDYYCMHDMKEAIQRANKYSVAHILHDMRTEMRH